MALCVLARLICIMFHVMFLVCFFYHVLHFDFSCTEQHRQGIPDFWREYEYFKRNIFLLIILLSQVYRHLNYSCTCLWSAIIENHLELCECVFEYKKRNVFRGTTSHYGMACILTRTLIFYVMCMWKVTNRRFTWLLVTCVFLSTTCSWGLSIHHIFDWPCFYRRCLVSVKWQFLLLRGTPKIQ